MSHNANSGLPLVVQLGFSGSRSFVPAEAQALIDETAFNNEVAQYLTDRLHELPKVLDLPQQSFLCGVCQLAIGGDTFFVQACQKQGIPVRIFLPQPPDVFFDTGGEVADFTAIQKEQGKALLASPDVIQLRVIGNASTRDARFEEVNHEIARVSDVLVCLIRKNAGAKLGGALAVLERASVRQRPVLKIIVGEKGGRPTFETEWIDKDQFVVPHAPAMLAHKEPSSGAPLPIKPPIGDFVARLREESRVWADRYRNRFTIFATTIIGTHVLATLLALLALVLPHSFAVLPWLLGLELALLLIGFRVHWWVHSSHVVQNWSTQRLIEQIASSVDAVGGNHVPLEHFFNLPLPEDFRSLMRTLNVLHLSSARHANSAWENRRDKYVKDRVEDQMQYYKRTSGRSAQLLRYCHYAFMIFSAIAIVATGTKLAMWAAERISGEPDTMATASKEPSAGGGHGEGKKESVGDKMHSKAEHTDPVATVLGALAVFLPVLAVGAMSIAAAHDLEGRIHTYKDMEKFLKRQQKSLKAATSEGDFVRLLMETESRLLGETANWFSRRSFTGVA